MICTSLVPNIELFNLPVFLFITPMFLFGGTFFPVENPARLGADNGGPSPAHPPGRPLRAFTNGRIDAGLLPGIGYLAAFAAVTFPLALYKMRNG